MKLDALTAERDALLRAQAALADENTRLATEASSLKVRQRCEVCVERDAVSSQLLSFSSLPQRQLLSAQAKRTAARQAPAARVDVAPEGAETGDLGAPTPATAAPVTRRRRSSLAPPPSVLRTSSRLMEKRARLAAEAEAHAQAQALHAAITPPDMPPPPSSMLRRAAVAAAALAERLVARLSPPSPAQAGSRDAATTTPVAAVRPGTSPAPPPAELFTPAATRSRGRALVSGSHRLSGFDGAPASSSDSEAWTEDTEPLRPADVATTKRDLAASFVAASDATADGSGTTAAQHVRPRAAPPVHKPAQTLAQRRQSVESSSSLPTRPFQNRRSSMSSAAAVATSVVAVPHSGGAIGPSLLRGGARRVSLGAGGGEVALKMRRTPGDGISKKRF